MEETIKSTSKKLSPELICILLVHTMLTVELPAALDILEFFNRYLFF